MHPAQKGPITIKLLVTLLIPWVLQVHSTINSSLLTHIYKIARGTQGAILHIIMNVFAFAEVWRNPYVNVCIHISITANWITWVWRGPDSCHDHAMHGSGLVFGTHFPSHACLARTQQEAHCRSVDVCVCGGGIRVSCQIQGPDWQMHHGLFNCRIHQTTSICCNSWLTFGVGKLCWPGTLS